MDPALSESIIDFGRKLLSLDASLRDSRVAAFTLYGDMAMRLAWGDEPQFALAVGGLNPHFKAPRGFPVSGASAWRWARATTRVFPSRGTWR